jgi:DNA-binding NtrC family response regulator
MSDAHLKVLVVDDQPAVVHALGVLFDVHGLPCVAAASPEEAMERIEAGDVGVVVQDMNFGAEKTSGEEGIRLFRRIRETDADLPVLLMTAWASLETAVHLIKEGANDYLAKPWDDDKLVVTVRNLLRIRELQLENERLQLRGRKARQELGEKFDLCGMVYESEETHRLVSLAVNVARSDAPVLVTGPSGAGKEKLAEIVQANSRRRNRPFVRVNVGALPEELMEAELFGAEPGAFTGATTLRVGRFEAADGGTLFLDEIDALSLAGQVKFLRVVQTGEFQRLGSSKTRHADVRIVCATNSDLKEAVADGRFREDLYYRVNVVELALPGLESRPEDILPLALHFLAEIGEKEGRPEAKLSPETEAVLLQHGWPGNVRELQNRIQRATLTSGGGVVEAEHLDLDVATRPPSAPTGVGEGPEQPTDPERARIEGAILEAEGVVARAAERLGMSRQALYRKMEKLGIVLERRPR